MSFVSETDLTSVSSQAATTKRRSILTLTVVLVVYAAGIAAAFWLCQNWTARQTVAVILTGAVVIWYTWETMLLRQTSNGQAEVMLESAKLAAEANQITRDAYIASERPWVSVDATVNTDLVRKDGGVEFGILFRVQNHGNSPAVNVRVCYEVVALRVAPDPFGGVRQRIEKLRNMHEMGNFMGIQLFPSETREIQWKSPLTKQEIEAAKTSNSRHGYLPAFYVIGSVFYQSPFGDETFQTGFNYYVLDKSIPGGGDLPDFDASFPRSHIVLVPQSYAKGTIN